MREYFLSALFLSICIFITSVFVTYLKEEFRIYRKERTLKSGVRINVSYHNIKEDITVLISDISFSDNKIYVICRTIDDFILQYDINDFINEYLPSDIVGKGGQFHKEFHIDEITLDKIRKVWEM